VAPRRRSGGSGARGTAEANSLVRGDGSTSFQEQDAKAALAQKKAEVELKIKELDRSIEEQRSRERALSDQEEQYEKEMGETAILTPAQEQAALKSRDVALQQDAVVDKTEQLVKEKLELLKELEKLQKEEEAGKEPVTPGETVTREIVGPAGEKEIEVVKEEEGGQEEVEEIKQETPAEAKKIEESGGQIVEPPPPPPEGMPGEPGLPGEPPPIQCPPCPPLPKPRERPLMISAEDEPPGKAPRVEVDVTESAQVTPPSLLFAPPTSVKNVKLLMPQMPRRRVGFGTAGDDRVGWPLPKHTPGLLIGAHPPSLAGALVDDEILDQNEVPDEYDDEPTPEEVMEAHRGGRAFLKMMDVEQQALPWLAALWSLGAMRRGPRGRAGELFL